MKDYCAMSPFCWSSNVLLVLGAGLTIFGLFSPFWHPMSQGHGVENLLYVCDETGNNCETIGDSEITREAYGSRGMIALGIFFALLSVITGFFICCCCPDAWDGQNHAMLAIKFTFMLLAGGLVAGGVVWWGLKTWNDWDDCTSQPSQSYAYYITCAGAGFLLIGGILTGIGLCCERETDHDDDKTSLKGESSKGCQPSRDSLQEMP